MSNKMINDYDEIPLCSGVLTSYKRMHGTYINDCFNHTVLNGNVHFKL